MTHHCFFSRQGLLPFLIFLLTGLAGCQTQPASSIAPPPPPAPTQSGFLKDYGQLAAKPGREGTLYYEKPGVNWSKYNRVMIDSVRIAPLKNDAQRRMSNRDLLMLATYFEYSMRDSVLRKYGIAKKPGSGVLKVRAAITDVQSSASLSSQMANKPSSAYGSVSMEGEIVDSMTNERLVAIVDVKAGDAYASFVKWDDATRTFDQWADQLYEVLYKFLGEGDGSPSDPESVVAEAMAAPVPAVPVLAPVVAPAAVAPPSPAPVAAAPASAAAPSKKVKKEKLVSSAAPSAAPAATTASAPTTAPSPAAVTAPAVPAPVAAAAPPASAAATTAAPAPAAAPPSAPAATAAGDPWNGAIGQGDANLNEPKLKPFVLGLETSGDLSTIAAAAKKRLEKEGFSVAGSYSPLAGVVIVVVTSNELKSIAAHSEFGGYGATVRVSIAQVGGKVQVSYTNPIYLAGMYRMKGNLTGVAAKVGLALGKLKTFGSAEGIAAGDLGKWHYMFGMPYFSDQDKVGSGSDYNSLVSAVEAAIKAGKGGIKKVYRVDIPGKSETVFGVAFTSGVGSDGVIMKALDVGALRHAAHLPYEVLVSGDKVYALNGKFRIAISFPDLTMGQFMNIKDAPGGIESSLKEAFGG
ncbi:exported hypothetical protein [Gammaproteobacteria bacterium]